MKLRKFVVSFLACSIALSLAVGLTGCGAQKQGPVKEGSIVVGASPSPHAQILEAVSEQLAQKGYQLEIKEFTDYIMPNTALEDGELDANFSSISRISPTLMRKTEPSWFLQQQSTLSRWESTAEKPQTLQIYRKAHRLQFQTTLPTKQEHSGCFRHRASSR